MAHGYFVIAAAAGLFVWPDPGPVLANYGIDRLRFTTPVKPGDEIHVVFTCKEKAPRRGAGYGEVRWDTQVRQPGRCGGGGLRRPHHGGDEGGGVEVSESDPLNPSYWSTGDGDVAELVLNRPERRNALDGASRAVLNGCLDELEKDPPRALLLRGEGKGFCAGRDLSDAEPLTEDGEAILSEMNPTIARIAGLRCPTVAAVQGAALGFGLGLALACDLIVVGESAKIGSPFAAIGAVLDSRRPPCSSAPASGRPARWSSSTPAASCPAQKRSSGVSPTRCTPTTSCSAPPGGWWPRSPPGRLRPFSSKDMVPAGRRRGPVARRGAGRRGGRPGRGVPHHDYGKA